MFCLCATLQSLAILQGAYLFIWGLPIVMWLNRRLRPGKGAAVLIPSTWLRYITFKFTADLQSVSLFPTS